MSECHGIHNFVDGRCTECGEPLVEVVMEYTVVFSASLAVTIRATSAEAATKEATEIAEWTSSHFNEGDIAGNGDPVVTIHADDIVRIEVERAD